MKVYLIEVKAKVNVSKVGWLFLFGFVLKSILQPS